MTKAGHTKFKTHIMLMVGIWTLLVLGQLAVNLLGNDRLLEYRAWEGVSWRSSDQPFIPLTIWEGRATGDLAHMAGVPQLAQPRDQVFTTDECGFRNPAGTLTGPMDVVICGDSFAAGSHLSEEETLAHLLRREKGLRVYNYAGARPELLLGDQRFAGAPPRVVLLLITEMFSPQQASELPDQVASWMPRRAKPRELKPAAYHRKKILDLYSSGRYLRVLTEPIYGGLSWYPGLRSLPETIGHVDRPSGMMFHGEEIENALDPELRWTKASRTIDYLEWYSEQIRDWGSTLLVVLAPSKATLYNDRVPALAGVDENIFYDRFKGELTKRDVYYYSPLDHFRAVRERYPERELYFVDDTHMTKMGQLVMMQALMPMLQDGKGRATP